MNRIPRDLVKHLEWKPGSEQPPAPMPPVVTPSQPLIAGDFRLEELADRYIIGPVAHRGESYCVAWSKEQLDGGAQKTQDDWNAFLKDTEWRLGSGPLQIALLRTLFNAREGAYKDLVEKVRSTVVVDYDGGAGQRAVTGTRIIYSPKGLDKVVHEYGTPDAYEVKTGIVGPDAWLKPGCGYDDSVGALIGLKDFTLLNEITQWVKEKDAYFWRINSQPSAETQRALVLGVYGDWFLIGANIYDIDDDRPARGVAVEKISGSATGVLR